MFFKTSSAPKPLVARSAGVVSLVMASGAVRIDCSPRLAVTDTDGKRAMESRCGLVCERAEDADRRTAPNAAPGGTMRSMGCFSGWGRSDARAAPPGLL